MNICKNTVAASIPKLIAGNLYYSTATQCLYIYCKGRNAFVNMEQGTFYSDNSVEFLKSITDVTNKYCLKEI